MRDVLNSLEPSMTTFLLISAIVSSIAWLTFPTPGNFVLSLVMRLLSGVPLFTILLGAIMWDRMTGTGRLMVILLATSSSLLGLVALTKLLTLLPWVILTLGWWLNGRMAKAGIALLLVIFAFHFLLLSNLTAVSRTHSNYEPGQNTLQERVVIIWNSDDRIEELRQSEVSGNSEQRFATAPFQAYFMTLYDTGFPGDTFEAAKTILIPRFLWREKPVFAPGDQFDLVFRGVDSESSLAIGIFSEGYWNAGWLGIVIVSLTVGIQLGWFTRKWLLFTQYGAWHIGAFLLSPVVVYSAAWAEVNFVGGYVGGTVRTAIIMMVIDLMARVIISYRRAQLRV